GGPRRPRPVAAGVLVVTAVVIGAGLSGLVRAYALARSGLQVRLLEESDQPGGVVRTELRDGFLLELGPSTVRPTAELWDLVLDGRLHVAPMSAGSFLSTRLLSVRGKLRVLGEPFVPAKRQHESVRAFFGRRLGAEVAERLVEPFVSGVFAGDASRLSMEGC